MEKYVDDFIKSNTSLLHYCDTNKISYRQIYFYIKEHYPNLISRKNNGKSARAKQSQKSSIKFNPTKEELEKLFFEDGLGQREIAEYYKVSKALVCKKMKQYCIDVRSVGQSRYWNDSRREHFRMLANTGVVGVFRNQNWKYHSTSIENFFIDECERLNISYKRQYPIEKYGHQYDFYIQKYNLLVEMDGEYFHNLPKQKVKDLEQMQRCGELGYIIVRITDKEIAKNKNIVGEIFNGFEKNIG
jgi:very-short-patch-repair endonuclease